MKTIPFAAGLSLPIDAATQTFGFIGRKGSGKSYAADKCIEGLFEYQVPICIIDPIGRHYGLRLSKDGKSPGLDFVILGGLRGDIPLDESAGKLIADAFIDSGRSFIVDVSQFSLSARKRFVTAFGEQLWQRQKALMEPTPVHVVLEESQLFLPQQTFKGDEHMVGIWTEIVRLGRNCGIGATLITQRPQSVSKEALTQVECMVVFQVNGPPEKKALKEWIVEKGADTNLLEELPFLKRGTAYIWSPQWLEHFGKHEILGKKTFDSSATPKVGAKKVNVQLKPLDLTELKEKMAAVVQKGEENDPRALKRKIAELEHKLKQPVTVGYKVAHTKVEKVEVPALTEREIKRLEKASVDLQNEFDAVKDFMEARWAKAGVIVEVAKKTVDKMKEKYRGEDINAPTKPIEFRVGNGIEFRVGNGIAYGGPVGNVTVRPLKVNIERGPKVVHEHRGVDGEVKLIGRSVDMLQELINRSPDGMTKKQLAVWVGMSVGGGFNNYLGDLRRAGFIEAHGGKVFSTALGNAQMSIAPPRTKDELVGLWLGKLTGKSRDILQFLVANSRTAYSKEKIAEQVGMSVGGGFNNYLGDLRRAGLMVKDGVGLYTASPEVA